MVPATAIRDRQDRPELTCGSAYTPAAQSSYVAGRGFLIVRARRANDSAPEPRATRAISKESS